MSNLVLIISKCRSPASKRCKMLTLCPTQPHVGAGSRRRFTHERGNMRVAFSRVPENIFDLAGEVGAGQVSDIG